MIKNVQVSVTLDVIVVKRLALWRNLLSCRFRRDKARLRIQNRHTRLTRFGINILAVLAITIETHFVHHLIVDFTLDCFASPSESISLWRVCSIIKRLIDWWIWLVCEKIADTKWKPFWSASLWCFANFWSYWTLRRGSASSLLALDWPSTAVTDTSRMTCLPKPLRFLSRM